MNRNQRQSFLMRIADCLTREAAEDLLDDIEVAVLDNETSDAKKRAFVEAACLQKFAHQPPQNYNFDEVANEAQLLWNQINRVIKS
jgi:hypothetical protein